MELAIEITGKVAVVSVPVEELDASNTEEFKRDMAPVLGSQTRVVLDLKRVQFIDSSGLGAMLSCLRQLRSHGGDLKLSGMSAHVRAAFELVRLHRVLDIYASSAEAVKAFDA